MRATDAVVRTLISVGGIGTILAVCGVFVFLLWVVKDLFLEAKVGEALRTPAAVAGTELRDLGVDEYRNFGWTLDAGGTLRGIRLDDQSIVQELSLQSPGGPALTAFSRDADGASVVCGYADGTLRLGRIGFETDFVDIGSVTPELRRLAAGEIATVDGRLVERTARGQFRSQRLVVELGDPVAMHDGVAIRRVFRAARGGDVVVAAIGTDGAVALRVRAEERDVFGDVTIAWGERIAVPIEPREQAAEFAVITDLASNLVVAWPDGGVERWTIREPTSPRRAESAQLTPTGQVELTAFGLLLGGVTLICGRSDGVVTGWFVAPDPTNPVDGMRLVQAHEFAFDDGAAVVSVATSSRERIFVVGTADGVAQVLYMTSGKRLATLDVAAGRPVTSVALAPKNDGVLAAAGDGFGSWRMDPRHPEVTVGSLFGKVWYERRPAPEYAWQSSSGTDDYEPKLSLVPLVFGTLKATFYSMMLGVPLALLAALYTSEFLSGRAKARIKPVVELMASLPSVVLGFLAAIVIAPAIEPVLSELLASLVTVPAAVILAAALWQSLPLRDTIRLGHLRLPFVGLAAALGLGLGWLAGPALESAAFGGDVRLWLDGQTGSGAVAWAMVLLPPIGLLVMLFVARRVNPWLRERTAAAGPGSAGRVHLLKTLIAGAAAIAAALAVGALIHDLPTWFSDTAAPNDLRDGLMVGGFDLSPFGTYDQRNALVVGFVMGFAIIPIIYTIADDALSSVPDHLRAASLGAGATPWQTALRVVVPAATSGLFSACMVGLGRAVGETMIVLMAAGNTPVLEWNAFNGFRSLSANIATELPEAVRDSTHYRTLFLAALVLFAMTFVVNTVAELVRLRIRARGAQL